MHRQSVAASRVSSVPPSQKRPMSPSLPQDRNTAKMAPDQKAPRQSAGLSGSLGRTRSNDSDSSSSFKRCRRASPSGSQVTMKRTLRGGETRNLSTANGPNIARPMSPRASTMRTTLRGTEPPRQSSIFASLNKRSRSQSQSKTLSASFRSRFLDSDEEADEGRPRRFYSRFADSSDEDEPLSPQFRPVRGIPRRGANDGDSTDLEDSSDEENNQTGRPDRDEPQPGSRMTQNELERYLSQPKKRGLLARLTSTRKKDRFKDGKVRKSDLDSPARRDTPLERSRVELEQMKGDGYFVNGYAAHTVTTTVTANPRQASPKPQKRRTGESSQNDASWPLKEAEPSDTPQGPAGANDPTSLPDGHIADRPQTSDGVVHRDDVNGAQAGPAEEGGGGWSTRFPKFPGRRDTSSTNGGTGPSKTASDVVVGKNGRKKRFPLLRKAFGLRD